MHIPRKLLDKNYLWVVAFAVLATVLIWGGMEFGWALREFLGPEHSGVTLGAALGAIVGYAVGAAGKRCCCHSGSH